MATPGDQKSLLPTCSKSGQLNTFKLQAVKKPIECAVGRHDCEIHDKLQHVLDSHGEQASVELHKRIKKQTSLKHQLPGLEGHK